MVQAVLRLAARQEPGSITTTHIANEIGLSQGSVFRHFPSKEAVWQAVAAWLETALPDILSGAMQEDHSPLENLAAMFHAHIRFVQENPGVPRFIFHELQQPADSSVKQQVGRMLQAYRSILSGQLQQARMLGLVSADVDEQSAATLFIGCLQGLVMQSMLAGKGITTTQAAGMLALYLRAVQPKQDL